MRQLDSALVQSIGPHTSEWAVVMCVSVRRAYEMLAPGHNCFEKAKRAILAVGKVNPGGIKYIRADIDACLDEAEGMVKPVTLSESHRAVSKAVQSLIDGLANSDQQWCLRMAIAALTGVLRQLQRDGRFAGERVSTETRDMVLNLAR